MKRKIILAALVCGAVLMLSGCGNASLDDQFVFGKNRLSCGGETITVEVPFELGVGGKMADLAPKDAEKVNAEGHNKNMQILVTGERDEGKTPESQAEAAVALLKSNGAVKNLNVQKDSIQVGERQGVRLTFAFTDTEKGRATNLTVKEYIFRQNHTFWRVIYQYRTEDPVGKALADRVEGKIVMGATF